MDENRINKQRALISLFLLFIYSGIVVSYAQESYQEDLVLTLRNNPIFIAFLILPLILWIFFIFKGNKKEALTSFLRNELMDYFGKFMALIITTYLAYFVLITHKNKDYIDVLIEIVLAIVAFALFLFATWFEESKSPPLTKESSIKLGKILLKSFLVIIIPFVVLYLLYYFMFSLIKITGFVFAFLHTILSFSALSPVFKKRNRIIFSSVQLFFQLAMVFWATKVPEFGLNYISAISIGTIGSILIIIGLIMSFKCENKVWFKNFTKDLYYQKQ